MALVMRFEPAEMFEGPRPGGLFTTGPEGTGYYPDKRVGKTDGGRAMQNVDRSEPEWKRWNSEWDSAAVVRCTRGCGTWCQSYFTLKVHDSKCKLPEAQLPRVGVKPDSKAKFERELRRMLQEQEEEVKKCGKKEPPPRPAPQGPRVTRFVAASFCRPGGRLGGVFKTGPRGVGYYPDMA